MAGLWPSGARGDCLRGQGPVARGVELRVAPVTVGAPEVLGRRKGASGARELFAGFWYRAGAFC